jgi:hypothetical protein
MVNGNPVLALGIVLLLAIGGWLYAAPYLAVRSMKAAADAKDGAELSSYVDFPSIRESLKAGLGGKVAAAAAPAEDNPLVAFGAALASTLADPMIDLLVTPDSLALMLRGDVPQRAAAAVAVAAPGADLETSMGYNGLNTFVFTAKRKGSTGNPITFVMTRRGVSSWKLSAVRLP